MSVLPEPHLQEHLLNRRRVLVLRFGAVALIAFGVIDIFLLQDIGAGSMIVRAGWALSALLIAHGLQRTSIKSRRHLMLLFGATSPLFYANLLAYHGGAQGVAFAFFLAVPIVFSVLLPGELEVAIASSVSTLLAGLSLLAYGGASTALLGRWAAAFAGGGLIAIYAAVLHRQLLTSEQAMNRERLQALEQVALSNAARARAEQLALLGLLAAGLGHEVNNPLAVLTTTLTHMADTIRANAKSTLLVELLQLVDECDQSATRIAAVMRELGNFAPLDREAEQCDLVPLLREILAEQQPRGLVTHDALPNTLPSIKAFEPQLRRMIKQLLLSAAESFNPSLAAPVAHVWIGARFEGGAVLLSLDDNGPELWIPGERVEAVSPPAYRGTRSGLGLALVSESLRQWGGSLTVTPRDKGGACMILRFVVAQESSAG